MTPEAIEIYIKKIALLFRYGTKEKILIFLGISFFILAAWIPKVNDEFLNLQQEIIQSIALGLYVLGGLCIAWVVYRFLFKLALPKPQDDRELPNTIKGLLAFTQEDGELFRKLGRDQELISLKAFVQDSQIPIVVIMGESGAGKSSLLRAGLSHLIIGSNSTYVYWEALPHDAVGGLLRAINNVLNTNYSDLHALAKLSQKMVIVLDQFEQLLPDNLEHKPIFELLSNVWAESPPYSVTWCIAFRREYSATWRDFELEEGLRPRMLSLKLFSVAQAQNVFVTLAEKGGLNLDQDLVDGFIKTVSHEQRVSPVEIGIGLQMLYELAQSKQMSQLSLQDYNFAGGSQGLFVNFLNNALIQRFPEPSEREALYKVLLECVDLNRNQRIAEGKSMTQLAESIPGFPAKHLCDALDDFSSGQMRILEKLNSDPPRYRLSHESMIPALRQLGGKILSEAAEAEYLLQTAFAAWQNNSNKSKYLLDSKDLKKILKSQVQIDLGDIAAYVEKSKKNIYIERIYVLVGIIVAVYVTQFSINSIEDEFARTSLINWKLPGEVIDYKDQLKSLHIHDYNIQHLRWLKGFHQLTTLSLVLEGSEVSDLNDLRELKQLTTLNLDLRKSKVSNLIGFRELKNLTKLTTLNLDLSELKDIDLSGLNELKQLATLNLNLSFAEVTNLNILKDLKQLTELNLNLSNSSISDLSGLNELKQLTRLTLNLSGSSNTNLDGLKELKQLTELNLNLSSSSISDLSGLNELKQLATLNLNLNFAAVTNLNILKELHQLTKLNLNLINSRISENDLSVFKGLTKLTTLDLYLNDVPDIDLSILNELKQLTTLKLFLRKPNNINLDGLKELKQLNTLELVLYWIEGTTFDLSSLKELDQLTTLNFSMSTPAFSDLKGLNELKKLTSLTLNLRGSSITNLGGLKELKQLNKLDLYLSGNAFTDLSQFIFLKELKQLTDLNLNGIPSDGIPSVLKELKQLTKLSLQWRIGSVNDLNGLKELNQLTELTTLNLNLSGSNINDLSVLKELKSMSKLTTLSLNLSNTEINNSSLVGLEELKQLTSLILDLSSTKINDLKSLLLLEDTKMILNIQSSDTDERKGLSHLIKGLSNLSELRMGNYKDDGAIKY